jgi:glutaredoxin-related protein
MKQTDINRIRYEVERQVFNAIDRELEELNKRFVKKANQYHQILFSDEAINIVDHTFGITWEILREKRERLKIKEMENWNASGEVLKQQIENRKRWIELKVEL